MQNKKNYLDVLRIIAIFMVFNFHFMAAIGALEGPFFLFTNGDWGNVGTTLFFLISGNCLARNYGEKFNAKTFYAKRWLSIFPCFYLCYIMVFFIQTILLHNQILLGVTPWRFIFTLLGIDNYLLYYGIETFALVGEWYTAIILCIYLLFPLLQFIYKKCKLAGSILAIALYAMNIRFTWGPVPDDVHLITGITMFWIGMMLFRFEEKLEHMPWFLFTGIVLASLTLLFIKLPGPQLLRKNTMAILIFLFFMRLGPIFKKYTENKPIHFLSKIEYGIYLCHHAVLYIAIPNCIRIFSDFHPIFYYLICLVATLCFATVLTYVTKWITSAIRSKALRSSTSS